MSWVFQVMSSSPPRVGDLIARPPPGPLAHALIATLRQSDGAMAFLITFTQNKFFAMYLKGRAKEWGGKRQTGCKSLFCVFRSPKCRIETFLLQNEGRFMMVHNNMALSRRWMNIHDNPRPTPTWLDLPKSMLFENIKVSSPHIPRLSKSNADAWTPGRELLQLHRPRWMYHLYQ